MRGAGLAGLSARQLLCYAYGHRWVPAGQTEPGGGLVEDEFRCGCGCRKWELWTQRTRVSWGRARYYRPDSYKLGHRVTREDAKQEMRARAGDLWRESAGR